MKRFLLFLISMQTFGLIGQDTSSLPAVNANNVINYVNGGAQVGPTEESWFKLNNMSMDEKKDFCSPNKISALIAKLQASSKDIVALLQTLTNSLKELQVGGQDTANNMQTVVQEQTISNYVAAMANSAFGGASSITQLWGANYPDVDGNVKNLTALIDALSNGSNGLADNLTNLLSSCSVSGTQAINMFALNPLICNKKLPNYNNVNCASNLNTALTPKSLDLTNLNNFISQLKSSYKSWLNQLNDCITNANAACNAAYSAANITNSIVSSYKSDANPIRDLTNLITAINTDIMSNINTNCSTNGSLNSDATSTTIIQQMYNLLTGSPLLNLLNDINTTLSFNIQDYFIQQNGAQQINPTPTKCAAGCKNDKNCINQCNLTFNNISSYIQYANKNAYNYLNQFPGGCYCPTQSTSIDAFNVSNLQMSNKTNSCCTDTACNSINNSCTAALSAAGTPALTYACSSCGTYYQSVNNTMDKIYNLLLKFYNKAYQYSSYVGITLPPFNIVQTINLPVQPIYQSPNLQQDYSQYNIKSIQNWGQSLINQIPQDLQKKYQLNNKLPPAAQILMELGALLELELNYIQLYASVVSTFCSNELGAQAMVTLKKKLDQDLANNLAQLTKSSQFQIGMAAGGLGLAVVGNALFLPDIIKEGGFNFIKQGLQNISNKFQSLFQSVEESAQSATESGSSDTAQQLAKQSSDLLRDVGDTGANTGEIASKAVDAAGDAAEVSSDAGRVAQQSIEVAEEVTQDASRLVEEGAELLV